MDDTVLCLLHTDVILSVPFSLYFYFARSQWHCVCCCFFFFLTSVYFCLVLYTYICLHNYNFNVLPTLVVIQKSEQNSIVNYFQ